MDLDTFKFIYLVGVLALAIVRAYYRLLTRGVGVAVDRKTAGEIALMLQAAAGMAVIPLVFVFSSLLDFANYRFPTWTVWVGSVVLAAGGIACVARSRRTSRELLKQSSAAAEPRVGHERAVCPR